jgi:hypothetical protein
VTLNVNGSDLVRLASRGHLSLVAAIGMVTISIEKDIKTTFKRLLASYTSSAESYAKSGNTDAASSEIKKVKQILNTLSTVVANAVPGDLNLFEMETSSGVKLIGHIEDSINYQYYIFTGDPDIGGTIYPY